MAEIQNTIQWNQDFPNKATPDYRDDIMGFDNEEGKPVSFKLEALQAASATNILGVAHPTDSPSGTELNGQGYDVSNTSGAEQVFTNFLDSNGDPIVVPDGTSGVIRKSGGSWEFVEGTAKGVNIGYESASKNLYNYQANVKDKAVSISGDGIIDAPGYVYSGWIKVNPGQTITISGLNVQSAKAFMVKDLNGVTKQAFTINSVPYTITLSLFADVVAFNAQTPTDNQPDFTKIQLEYGSVATDLVEYKPKLVNQIEQTGIKAQNTPSIVKKVSVNKFNKYSLIYDKVASYGSETIIDSDGGILSKIYLKGDTDYVVQGLDTSVISKVLLIFNKEDVCIQKFNIGATGFANPLFFTSEPDAVYAYLVLKFNKNDVNPDLDNIMFAEGTATYEVVTPYTGEGIVSIDDIPVDPYPEISQSGQIESAWVLRYPNVMIPLATPLIKYMGVNSDTSGMGSADNPFVCVLFGDSVFAKMDKTSAGAVDPKFYPPGITSNAIAAYWFRGLQGEVVQDKRFDSGNVTETGTFTTISDDGDWDDATVRDTTTRVSVDTNAAITYTIPADKDVFSLIIRTDINGCDNVVITPSGGNGQIEFKESISASYVEGNAGSFSMKNAPRDTYVGNTFYGKRIFFRKTAGAKGTSFDITFSKGTADASKFLYWGIGYASGNNCYSILYDDARGGHRLDALIRYQQQLFDKEPDLVVFELPLINELLNNRDLLTIKNKTWDYIWGDRPGNAFANAFMLLKAEKTKVLFIIPQVTQPDFNVDGTYKEVDGVTAEQYYNIVKGLMVSKMVGRTDCALIDTNASYLADIDASIANGEFVNRYDALAASGTTGTTFTYDGIHRNDKGTFSMAKDLVPILTVATL